MSTRQPRLTAKIWWSNVVLFVSVHIGAFLGVCWLPPPRVARATLCMSFILWQLADFGVTVGYHRLYSHRAFRASLVVRVVLVALGSSACQGSIKWWCLRHRLHHRFTDDPVHDPYAATRGLFYSHMGWIFFKPRYERFNTVDQEDLDSDMLVRFQHKYYVPIAFILGFVLPVSLGYSWGDPVGGFIYGGLVTRLTIWHTTFLVNSLAHWNGLQPYSDEDTSKSNLLLAILTCGEGNHNFHAFPHDYRSGPSKLDWDPSKWVIDGLHYLGLVTSVRRARPEDIDEARRYMKQKALENATTEPTEPWNGKEWSVEEMQAYVASTSRTRCLIVIDGFVVDVTEYLTEHPGGAKLLRGYAIRPGQEGQWRDASWAFGGGLNNHSRAAKRRIKSETNYFAMADLEELVHLEQTFYDTGYTDGFAHGRIHGLIDGRALGREKGFEIWEEIGFYEGFARTWQAIYAQRAHPDQRTTHHITHLLDLVRQFPTFNPSPTTTTADGDPVDMLKLQSQIRSRYRALCASLGVRPTLRVGASAGEDAVDGPNTARRDVWVLEDGVGRPTVQGLSF